MSFDTERFILEIKKRPALWYTGTSEHSDRDLKAKSWEEIIDIFKKGEMTDDERLRFGYALQKKWKSIRGCYTRELNRQRMLKSGSGVGPRKREYVFFKKLKFLKEIVTLKELKIKEQEPLAVSIREKDNLSKEIRKIKKETVRHLPEHLIEAAKKSNKQHNSDDQEIIQDTKKTAKNRGYTDNQDEDQLFLLSLLSTLRRVPQNKKMATKMKIMALLDEATQPVS